VARVLRMRADTHGQRLDHREEKSQAGRHMQGRQRPCNRLSRRRRAFQVPGRLLDLQHLVLSPFLKYVELKLAICKAVRLEHVDDPVVLDVKARSQGLDRRKLLLICSVPKLIIYMHSRSFWASNGGQVHHKKLHNTYHFDVK
jgi:hypothetical protein